MSTGSKECAERVVQSLADKKHAFLPFIFFEVKNRRIKYNGKTLRKEFVYKNRPIMYASHVDSHIFAYFACCLQDRYETYIRNEQFLPSTYEATNAIVAYRKLGKNNIGFAKEAFDFAKSIGNGVVLTRDVSNFFGTIRHDLLKQRWLSVLGDEFQTLPPDHFQVFRAITQYSAITQEEIGEYFELNETVKPLQYGTIQQLRTHNTSKKDMSSKELLHFRNSTGSSYKCGFVEYLYVGIRQSFDSRNKRSSGFLSSLQR